ncbi:MAG: rhodanese-like domain-containing protein [Lentisphaerales bacterium]|nr:rhodanese-like domain-containing protein [Lentisphaerales bacterium]
MKKLITILIILLSMTLSAEDKKVFWIDVRSQQEFDAGHLKEAILIPYQKISKEIAKVTKDKNADIRVYCKVGGRAGIAKKSLEKMGYKNVTNEGGYEEIMQKRKKMK